MCEGLSSSEIYPFGKSPWSRALGWYWGHSGEQGRPVVGADRGKCCNAAHSGCLRSTEEEPLSAWGMRPEG